MSICNFHELKYMNTPIARQDAKQGDDVAVPKRSRGVNEPKMKFSDAKKVDLTWKKIFGGGDSFRTRVELGQQPGQPTSDTSPPEQTRCFPSQFSSFSLLSLPSHLDILNKKVGDVTFHTSS
jgi:hypothetical protein